MNNTHQGDIGWVKYAPVARRSIHYHKGFCPFVSGEFTVSDHNSVSKSSYLPRQKSTNMDHNEEDEVDNILSKPACPIGFETQYRRRRSQSFSDHQNENHIDDSTESDMENSYNISGSSSYTARSRSMFDESESELSSRFQYKHQQDSRNHLPANLVAGCLFASVIVIVAVYFNATLNTKNEIFLSKYDNINFNDDIYNLGEKYNLNEDSILQLQTGILSITEKEDTDSFIFVYNSKSQKFNHNAFNNFINEVAAVSAKFLRNESSTVRHVVVDTSSLYMRDYGEFINKYRDEISKGGVMVITRIDALPSSLAMALHYYCDEHNPLAKKSAIFFTLDLHNCSEKRTTHALIEKCLANKWNGISKANIGPLLSRVVSVLIDVTSIF